MKLIALLAPVGAALACTCGTGTPEAELASSDVVFSGTAEKIEVLSPTNGWANVKVSFRANETWKGTNSTSVVVFTGVNGNVCGYNFIRGTNYLVYATEQKSRAGERILITDLCTRTRPLAEAAADLTVLRKSKRK